MSGLNRPWEPDPAKLGNNWQALFEQRRSGGSPPPTASAEPAATEAFDDVEFPSIDPAEYKPWLLQRGRSRGLMMLALRWFDAKAGLWHGSALAYPSLYAVDSIGSRLVSLDFGLRQFVIEGSGLDELTRQLQQGNVVKIVEFASAIWPAQAEGAIVTGIRRVQEAT